MPSLPAPAQSWHLPLPSQARQGLIWSKWNHPPRIVRIPLPSHRLQRPEPLQNGQTLGWVSVRTSHYQRPGQGFDLDAVMIQHRMAFGNRKRLTKILLAFVRGFSP